MKRILTHLSIVVVLLGCSTVKVSSVNQNVDDTKYKELAAQKLGSQVDYTLNASRTYVLCVKDEKGTPKQPRNKLSFIVVKVEDNSIALEQNLEGATVGWYSDKEVEVFRIPGVMREDQSKDDFTTIYNVETGASSPKKGAGANN